MPKIRNVSDDTRVTRTLDGTRTVAPDEVFGVTDGEVAGFECQPRLWRVETGRKATSKDEVA